MRHDLWSLRGFNADSVFETILPSRVCAMRFRVRKWFSDLGTEQENNDDGFSFPADWQVQVGHAD